MDPRVFNVSVLAGLLLVAAGAVARYSWPVGAMVVGAILIVGSFVAAFANPPRS